MDLLQLGVPLLAGIVGAFVTYLLTLARFQKEKRWERKADAYDRLIIAMHEVNRHFQREFERAARQDDPPKPSCKEVKRVRAAFREIDRAIDLAAYLLSANARARLMEYRSAMRRADASPHWVEYLDGSSFAVSTCLESIIEIARREMGSVWSKIWWHVRPDKCGESRGRTR